MVRNVRNFWMDASVDGRNSDIGAGPRSKDGGMSVNILMRNDGSVDEGVKINCRVQGDELVIYIDGKEYKRTKR